MIHPSTENGIAQFSGTDEKGSWKVGQILHIGKIVNHKGEEVDSLVLEPQGIAHLVSKECVHLPDDVCALAHVLTRVCNEGLLTLNIGVVDPGWQNYLSTPVLNFSSEKRLLQSGSPFIRVTFHEIDVHKRAEHDRDRRRLNQDRNDYVSDVRARAVGSFGKNFLNIKQLVGQASKKETARFKEAMLKYLPIGAFSLAIFALLVTTGIATITRLAGGDEQQEILERLARLEKSMEKPVADGATVATEDPGKSQSGGVQR